MAEDHRNPKRVLTFTDHLQELRVRIVIVLVAFVVCFCSGVYFSGNMLAWLIAPLTHLRDTAHPNTLVVRADASGSLAVVSPDLRTLTASTSATALMESLATDRLIVELPGGKRVTVGARSKTDLFYLSPVEPFFLLLKGGALIAAVVVVPLSIYQLWLFVAPGLKRRERKVVRPVLVSSLLLFPLGASFAYFVSHFALQALLAFGDKVAGLQPNIVASEYLGFILTLMLVFGLIFEFPLVLVLLNRIGFVTSAQLVTNRRYALLIISVLAALVTPPDPFSMLAGILPLFLLYEVSIWVIRFFEKADRAEQLPVPAKKRL